MVERRRQLSSGQGTRTLNEILDRFRRPAGVPVAAAVEPDSELLELFAALDDLDHQADVLREASAVTVAAVRAQAAADADRVLDEGRREAERESVRTRAMRIRAAEEERDAAIQAARAENERMTIAARARIPALVDRVVQRVLEVEV